MKALACAVFVAATSSAQTLVVPASQTVLDGSSRFWVAGTVQARRQLTVIDGSLLAPLVGHTITGLSFRRNAENEAFAGGDATLTVRLSHSALSAVTAVEQFAVNHGSDLTTVFQGAVTLPTSPATTASAVPWSNDNVVRISFSQLFAYQGGSLAVDVTGAPGANAAHWWPADAVWQQNGGTSVSVGGGSGGYGGVNGEWSLLDAGNLGPGGTVAFRALGSAGHLGVLGIAVGTQAQRLDISMFGVAGSFLHILDPFRLEMALFDAPLVPPEPSIGAVAQYMARLPVDPAFLGVSMASQWFRIDPQGHIASSNAHAWSTAAQYPSLAMTLITAPVLGAEPTAGKVVPGCGHVMRFEFQ